MISRRLSLTWRASLFAVLPVKLVLVEAGNRDPEHGCRELVRRWSLSLFNKAGICRFFGRKSAMMKQVRRATIVVPRRTGALDSCLRRNDEVMAWWAALHDICNLSRLRRGISTHQGFNGLQQDSFVQKWERSGLSYEFGLITFFSFHSKRGRRNLLMEVRGLLNVFNSPSSRSHKA